MIVVFDEETSYTVEISDDVNIIDSLDLASEDNSYVIAVIGGIL